MIDSVKENKIIAKYLGWVYIPFNDLKGFPKAGWWEPIGRLPFKANPILFTHPNGTNYQFVVRNANDLSFNVDMMSLLKILQTFKKYKITPYS